METRLQTTMTTQFVLPKKKHIDENTYQLTMSFHQEQQQQQIHFDRYSNISESKINQSQFIFFS